MSKITLSGRNRINKRNSDYDRAKDNGYLGDESDWLNTQKNGVVSVYTVQKTYERDLRKQLYQTLDLVIDVTDLTGTLTITHDAFVTDGSQILTDAKFVDEYGTEYDSLTLNITEDTHDTSYQFNIRYDQANTHKETITIRAELGLFHSEEKIAMVDVTKTYEYFGHLSSAPTGSVYLEGDSFVLNDSTSQYDGRIYSYNSTMHDWVLLSNSGYSNETISYIASLSMHDILSTIPADTLAKSEYGYFNHIIAGVITADYISSKDISSHNYAEDLTGTPVTGYRLEHDGGENNDGEIKSVGGLFANMNVRGALRLWKNNDKDQVGADIEHPALTTVSETIKADPTGVTVANSPTGWDGNNLLSAVSGLTKNRIDSSSGTFGNKNLAFYIYADSLSFALKNAQSENLNASIIPDGISTIRTQNIILPNQINQTVTFYGDTTYIWWEEIGYSGRYISSNVRIYKDGSFWQNVYSSQSVAYESQISKTYSKTITLEAGHTYYIENEGWDLADSSEDYRHIAIQAGSLSYVSPAIYVSDYVSSTGFWIEYSNGTKERFDSGVAYLERMQMSDPVSFDSNNYRVLNDCSNFVNYWSFRDSDNVLHSLETGRTYKITSNNLYIYGNSVIGKYLTRNASSVALIYTYNGTTFRIEMNGSGSYHAYGTIKIAETNTLGVKMMGNYPKEDDTYDCGNSEYRWANVYGYYLWGNLQGGGSTRASKDVLGDFDRNALDIINSTKLVRFIRKDDKSHMPKIGFIAEDTDSDLSGENHDSFIYENCISVLMKAVQELSAKVTELEAKLQDK